MSTTSQHIAARDDRDLLHRFIAAAEQAGVPNAQTQIPANLGALISRPIEVNGELTSVTEVHAYADLRRREYLADDRALPPGLNPGAVTDTHLAAAIAAVLPTPPLRRPETPFVE